MSLTPGPDDALVVIDIQHDFLPGGSLAVADGDAIIAPVNALARRFANVVLTQDWHPAGHVSFASRHPGAAPFTTVELDYGPQVLWPDHCVIGTHGAEFSGALDIPHAQAVIRKGFRAGIDSYSGFRENDKATPTGLAGYLNERGLKRLFLCGLATDFCVAWTAEDGQALGFETVVVADATRPIDADGSLARAWARLDGLGVGRAALADFL